jgi:hypothetical protein
MTGSCEHGDKTSGYVKGEGILNQLNYYQLLKNNAVPYNYF